MSPKVSKRFRVVLERVESIPPWVIARLPFDPKTAWPEWNNRRVRGTLNGAEFQTSLLSTKGKGHWFVVYKKLLKAAGAKAGDTVEVRIEPDLEGHIYAEPKELTRVLRRDKDLRRAFDALPSSVRRWFAMFVDQAKAAVTRSQRAERIAETVMQVLEGEEIPPPILRAAFQRQPMAAQGWNASTRAQRRNYLLGIFMPQSIAARERRTAYVLEKCLETARRKGGRIDDGRSIDFE